MRTWTLWSGLFVALWAGGCSKTSRPAAGAGGGTASAGGMPTISDIMQQVNRRKSGLHSEVGELLQAATIDWDVIEPKAKNYAALADFLGKNDPPKGDKSSWESLTKAYAADAQGLHANVRSSGCVARPLPLRVLRRSLRSPRHGCSPPAQPTTATAAGRWPSPCWLLACWRCLARPAPQSCSCAAPALGTEWG